MVLSPAPPSDRVQSREAGELLQLGGSQSLMVTSLKRRPSRRGGRFEAVLAGAVRDTMYRNAIALAVNTGVTSVMGLAYWVLAARHYSAASVGESASLISALLVLANIAEFNLTTVLVRFLPTAGPRAARYVLRAYAAVVITGLVVAMAALPALRRIPLVDALLQLGPLGTIWLFSSVVAWCLFALQDSVVIGLRAAVWVPLENSLFGGCKILLLLVLADTTQRFGILASWTIPMLLTLLPMNALIFFRIVPRQKNRQASAIRRLPGRALLAFMTIDQLTVLASSASASLLPVVVSLRVGAEIGGYFYVAWIIGSALDVALVGVSASLTVEGAHQPEELGVLTRRLFRRVSAIALPIVAAVSVGAPLLLSLYGKEYASHSTGALRLVLLAVFPRIVIVLWMSANRVRRSIGRVLLVQMTLSAIVLTVATLYVRRYGILGVAIVHLGTQTMVALVLIPSFWRLSAAHRDLRSKGQRGNARG